MLHQTMGCKWISLGHRFLFCAVLIIALEFQGCWSLNSEGLDLLTFRARITYDPYGALMNWNDNDTDPCVWSGVHCVGGKVQMLNLNGLYLEGTLAPEIGKLGHLRSLILSKNRFSGPIPKEIGGLTMLELLDLRDNDLNGTVPEEIGSILSLKRLLICDNKFEGSIPSEIGRLSSLTLLQFDESLSSSLETELGRVNRKFGHCIWQRNFRHTSREGSLIPVKGAIKRYLSTLLMSKLEKDSLQHHGDSCCDYGSSSLEQDIVQNTHIQSNSVRRKLLEQSSNLPALPAPNGAFPIQDVSVPVILSSGSFQAVPNATKQEQVPPPPSPSDPPSKQDPNNTAQLPQPSDNNKSSNDTLKYALIGSGIALFLVFVVAMFFMCRKKGVTTIVPWKTGLSGQLQKAFVTGVPKLNRSELETACEDFSNIIETHDGCTVYKGTLSSGVEIAVASTAVASLKEWSTASETIYHKKIETMSRVNHKNFVNLLGFCEEDEPFLRMMVFEYAPNGSLFEHLHIKEVEHLDWNTRMRIIMGTAYCLQHMHHDLNPPVSHPNLISSAIFLTDDYAAKIGDIGFWKEVKSKSNSFREKESKHSEKPPLADLETNVYSFGILLLETISGKLPYSDEHGSLVDWAVEHLHDKKSISYMVDPTLKSFKDNELNVICDVIQDCIQPDPAQRPTMRDVISKLREVIAVSPDAATPRLSPLWWAELEILSVEAT